MLSLERVWLLASFPGNSHILISQLWRKINRRLGTITTSQTGNGGVG